MTDERGGRYFREARFFLAGDKVAAQSHISDARSLMGYMRDQHAIGGPPIQVKYAALQDGTQIKAVMMNGQYQAEIVSPVIATTKKDESCDPFWSGLYIPFRSAEHVRVVNDEPETYIGVEWFYPSAYQMEMTPELFLTYVEDTDRIALPLYPENDVPQMIYPLYDEPKTHGPVPPTLIRVFSSRYSGEMRTAIQLLLGTGADLVLVDPIPVYTYAYAGTVGLVRIPNIDAEAPPDFWMVRFPANGYGVLAMRYPVCHEITDEQRDAGIEYVPIVGVNFPEDIAEALIEGDVLELMSAQAFSSLIEGYVPFYSDCGWAFSKSGHEAQNVLYKSRVTGSSSEYIEVLTRRIKFVFGASSESISCTGSVVESGHAHTTSTGSDPRFPDELNELVSFDQMSYPTNATSTVGPVYVYYIGDDEQVWSVHSAYNTDPVVEENLPTVYEGISAYPCPGLYYVKTWDAGSVETQYMLNGSPMTAARSGSVTTQYTEYYLGPVGSHAQYAHLGDGTFIKLESSALWSRSWNEVNTGVVSLPTVFVSPFQREGLNVLDFTVSSVPTYIMQEYYVGVPSTGEVWQSLLVDPEENIYQLVTYYPTGNGTLPLGSIANCSGPISGIYTGTSGASGYEGKVTFSAGISVPVPDSSQTVVPASSPHSAKITFYGSATVVVANLTEAEANSVFLPSNEEWGKQHIYSFTSAIETGNYILSAIDPASGADFLTNTAYPLSDSSSVFFNLIGIT